jgi:hypothetical protein
MSIDFKGVICACLLTMSGAVSAATIDIDFTGFSVGDNVSSLGGVSFSLLGGPESGGAPAVQNWSETNVLTNSIDGSYPTADRLQFTFDNLVNDISFVFNNAGNACCDSTGDSYYEAYDAGGNLLASGSLMGAFFDSFNVVASNVKYLQFNNNTEGTDSWIFGVASLSATVVPIPAAVWLLGSALAGLGWLRRKPPA